MKAWLPAIPLFLVFAALFWQPPFVMQAEAWVAYRVTGTLPPPIVIGRNGRLFLGNHEGSPPRSLIADVCGGTVAEPATRHAAATIRPVLDAGRATDLPFRFLIIPTAPRIYPEDVPADIPCSDFAADRLVAELDAPDVIYPVAEMQALKQRFEVLPKRHFHWAGEGPLRVAEVVGERMDLARELSLGLKPDNRSSDLNGFDPGVGLHDRIGTPDLRRAGVAQCGGARCSPALPDAIVAFTHPGPGRLLLLADSFGDEIGGDFAEFAGTVWLVRMNVALVDPEPPIAAAIKGFHPDEVIVAYHDAGALALDAASQTSLAIAARLLGDVGLPARQGTP